VEHSTYEDSPNPALFNFAQFVNSRPGNETDSGRSDTVSVKLDSEGKPYAILGGTRIWSQTSAHFYQGPESTDGSEGIV